MAFKQTVEAAVHGETGEILYAADLLKLSAEGFAGLRRAAAEDLAGLRPPGAPPLFACLVCGARLWLARRHHRHPHSRAEEQNRFFKHGRSSNPTPCPWYDPSGFTKEQLLALRFHGQREGHEHRALKTFVAQSLARDARVADVVVDRVQLGKVLEGEWKKPDVRCQFGERRVVFELQLSYTFITEVVKRDQFYRAEGAFLIWIFARINETRAVVVDEKYYNQRNLFVLDDEAKAQSERRGTLVLHCHYWVPQRHGDKVLDEPAEAFVTLEDLHYPQDTFRPYFFDYDGAAEKIRQELLRERARRVPPPASPTRSRAPVPGAGSAASGAPDIVTAASIPRPESMVATAGPAYAAFNTALLRYGVNGASRESLDAVTFAAYELPSPSLKDAAVKALGYPRLDALVRLVGIANGVPALSQRKDLYSMLASSLQVSATTQRAFAFLYCAAWNVYQPGLHPRQRMRYGERVQDALDSDDPDFRIDRAFATLCAWLLPRLDRSVRLRSLCMEVSDAVPRAWSLGTQFDRNRVRAVGKRYMANAQSVDWRAVYAQAQDARNQRSAFMPTVIEIAKGHDCQIGDVFAFLTDCFT